ncbi:MAG TPA: polysaccharide deacetylase family protein [Bradyrhizobium sp.]|uniref:polysaccharide deacetylase family protein n=1 Tax=Bradyrhizobium sp. TaxID=376 RepID=UPI002D7E21E6|nr:polysaccharide deacetylase family protein [Bradyrhizobium sp.]HET7888373.1 polysaccharide deacetylase family protein [Bradyrhizobium sp.]
MDGARRGGRLWREVVVASAVLAGFAAQAALAADCPGRPDALGTSRTLVVDPREHPRIGTMQYPETLPLADHEVVLTFDDGPLPKNSNKVLDILAAECVKATFFTIGSQARNSPEGVRKLLAAGHTIGTHTQTHPLTMNRMPIERAKQEIEDGIASVKAALGDDADALAPFFRIPGLMRADAVEDYLAGQGIQVWSADFLADDWHHISSQRVYDLAVSRLEAKGKGILLLHDIQARTVAALPRILETLKARGYHIVHVVPATPDRPATPTEPPQWLLHPAPGAIAQWPEVASFVAADLGSLPAPARIDFDAAEESPILHRAAFARPTWPEPPELAPGSATVTLAAPASSLFEIEGGLDAALHGAALSRRTHKAASAEPASTKRLSRREARRLARANSRASRLADAAGHRSRYGAAQSSRQKPRTVAAAHRGPVKRLVQIRKRRV